MLANLFPASNHRLRCPPGARLFITERRSLNSLFPYAVWHRPYRGEDSPSFALTIVKEKFTIVNFNLPISPHSPLDRSLLLRRINSHQMARRLASWMTFFLPRTGIDICQTQASAVLLFRTALAYILSSQGCF
jgi:hypothetical protein